MKGAAESGDAPLATLAYDSTAALTHVPMRLGGWSCKAIQLTGEDRLTVRFESAGSADWVEVSVLPKDAPGPIFKRLSCCALRYRGSLTAATRERKAEIGALVMGIGGAIDARLAASPGMTIAEALGRTRGQAKMVFGRESLRALLAPEITEGAVLAGGFALADVYPSSHMRESIGATLELILDFRRGADLRRMLIVVTRRNDDSPAFARTSHFSLTHMSRGAADPEGADELRTLVSFVLQLHDHDELEIVFPDITADVAPALLMPAQDGEEAPASDEVLNLAIDTECHQQCAFCSIKDTRPAEDGGDLALARLYADLASNRERGVRAVRVNGYDPLTYSRILDVMRRATDLGYEKADVFSPCTRLSDRAFCEQVIDALPEKSRFYVPLYGVEAEPHDRVVGRDGAFAMVMKAIDHLIELRGKEAVCILSVATKDALDEMIPLAAFARSRGLSFYPHMPYPSFETRGDRYFTSAPKQTDVAKVVTRAQKSQRLAIHVHGVAPCITFKAMREAGVPLREWLQVPDRPPTLPGTEYREARFRHRADENDHAAFHASAIPCPHASKCTLLDACPGEVLRSYAELYGTDELSPVTLRELLSAT